MRRATKKYKVTVVGLGAMGLRHLRVLGAVRDRFEVVGAYDIRADASPPDGVVRLASQAEAIGLADVVVVATPIEAHASVATAALAAGRHVFVEKPMCASGAEARSLVAGVRGGVRLFVGHSERFNPVVRALSRLLHGEVVASIEFRRVGPSRPAGCGALLNLGVHDIDLAAYLVGGEIVIQAALGAGGLPDIEDFAHVLFSTTAGAVGHLCVDRAAAFKQRTVVVATRRWIYEGNLLFPHLVRTMRASSSPARTEVPLPLGEPLTVQALALADALDGRSGREIATGADGARAVDLAEQAASHCARARAELFGVASERRAPRS